MIALLSLLSVLCGVLDGYPPTRRLGTQMGRGKGKALEAKSKEK